MFGAFEWFKVYYMRSKGERLLLRGRPEAAFPYLETAVLLDDSYQNLYNLVLSLLGMNRHEEAESYLRILVERAPDNLIVILTLVELYTKKRAWSEAEQLLRNALDAHPTNQNLNKYLQRITDPKKRENYLRAKELLNNATNDLMKGKADKGFEKLQKALLLDPANSYIHNHLGTIYLKLKKDPQKAFEHYLEAYKLSPESKKFKQDVETVRKIIAKEKE